MASRGFTIGFLTLLVISAFALIAFALRQGGEPVAFPTRAVLVFRAPYLLEEGAPPRGDFPLGALRPEPLTVWDVVRALRGAARDPRIVAVVVQIHDLGWGWGRIAEVRDALQEVRAQGKPVYAALDGGSEAEYLLASAADVVAVPPVSLLQLDGLSMSALYVRGTLDKLGITPNFAHVGRFKAAVETYTRTGMSDEARLSLQQLLDDEFSLLADSLATGRGMDPDSVRSLIDRGPFTSEQAWQAGLVDTLLYPDQVDSLALDQSESDAHTVSLSRYLSRMRDSPTAPRIALISASGTIVSGRSRGGGPFSEGLVGSESVISWLREARERSSVKAIVLRVDSPGGDGFASDAIWKEVERCRQAKPVVVSMSDLAASGGYYISMGADAIVAQPATITGSIGVFGGKFNQMGLLRKIGLNVEGVARGRHAEMLSPYRDFTVEERGIFERQMEAFYRHFVALAAQGRGLSETDVDSAGGGRVWSAVQARDRGLVDQLGGLPVAFRLAREKAGIDADSDIQVTVYPRPARSWFERMLTDALQRDDEGADQEAGIRAWLPEAITAWGAMAVLPSGSPWAMMPFTIEFR